MGGSEMINVEVIHKEIIKPSSPTPHHLRYLPLSVFDQFKYEIYLPHVVFYPSSSEEHSLVAEKSELLKKSLSEALTQFYPFAGEFKYNDSINCDDRGAVFLEAQVNCPMSKILDDKHGLENMGKLIPTPVRSKHAQGGHLLLVQANVFECGGLAIAASFFHKVVDALSISKFMESWAEIARCSASTTDHHVVLPTEFCVAATLFPPQEYFNSPKKLMLPLTENYMVRRRRFVFDASKIAALKVKAASATVPSPTRVEAVSVLIWKCAMEASRSNLGFVRSSTWRHAVNMRKILAQPFAENLLGNFSFYAISKVEENEANDLQILVAKLRKSVEELKVKHTNEIRAEDVVQFFKEYGELIEKDDMDNYTCSSLCRFPFCSANFGWRKPSCTRFPLTEVFKNMFLLSDATDGNGIEAYLSMKEEDMVMFETNQDLLTYASLQ
ncbi:acyltransferase Pun1-like [Pyrus x bretschneideri]|uniref:acyltransferase Pun1-like n=1 Tax=Pyrus x bretschneideri TaxID=225117 RepID=UPI00202F4B9C|nr:acyltransferase Pun1-like [Pyrus x bretschneideri]